MEEKAGQEEHMDGGRAGQEEHMDGGENVLTRIVAIRS
jgi:hypothetical protein